MTLDTKTLGSTLGGSSGKDAIRRIREHLQLSSSVSDKDIFFMCASLFFTETSQAHAWANHHHRDFEHLEIVPTIIVRCANPLDYLPRLLESYSQGILPA